MKRPQGHTTRGKTAPNRLRRLDAFLARRYAPLLRRRDGPFRDAVVVDLGFGRVPETTVEMHRRFCKVAPGLETVGVEIDRERVLAAAPYAEDRLSFVHGGFDVKVGAPVRLLRAMNVLRQYDEADVPAAWNALSASLPQDGLVVDGTSDEYGKNLVALLLVRTSAGLDEAAILFSGTLRSPFDPERFPPVLPKRWIHRMLPGEAVYELFEAWREAWRRNLGRAPLGPRDAHVHTVRDLVAHPPTRFFVDPDPWLPQHGHLLARYALDEQPRRKF